MKRSELVAMHLPTEVKFLVYDSKHRMKEKHPGHYHQKMKQLQLHVRLSIAIIAFIPVALTLIYTGTFLLPSQQT